VKRGVRGPGSRVLGPARWSTSRIGPASIAFSRLTTRDSLAAPGGGNGIVADIEAVVGGP
jgi:hypothetical protein